MRNHILAGCTLALCLTSNAVSQEAQPEVAAEAGAATAAKIVDIPQTRIRLPLRQYFSLQKGLPGLTHAFPMTQLIVTELPVSFEDATESMVPDLVARRGLSYDRREEFWTESGTGDLYYLKEDVDPADLRHWVLLLGNEKQTLRITLTTLAELESRVEPEMRRVLESVEWRLETWRDLQRDKAFRVDVPETLIPARSARRRLELWDVNQIGEAAGGDVRVVVSRYVVPDAIGDLNWFAEQHLASARELSNFERTDRKDAVLGGLPGIELLGEGTAFDDGSELTVYQVLALDGDEAYVIQGFTSAPNAERFVPVFRRLAASFRRAR